MSEYKKYECDVCGEIYDEAKKTAKAECRSIAHQIEYWAKIGKCALDNPDLPIEFIRDVLISKYQDKSLN